MADVAPFTEVLQTYGRFCKLRWGGDILRARISKPRKGAPRARRR